MILKGKPILARIYRWERAMHQYIVGHEERLIHIEQGLSKLPGLFLVGVLTVGSGAKLIAEQALRFIQQQRRQ